LRHYSSVSVTFILSYFSIWARIQWRSLVLPNNFDRLFAHRESVCN